MIEADLDARLEAAEVRLVEERVRMFAIVQPPCSPLNAPISTSPPGRTGRAARRRRTGAFRATRASRRLRPAPIAGRSASGAASVVVLRPPIFAGHCARSGLRRGLLAVAGELDLRVERRRRKRREQGLRDHLALDEVLEPGRVRVALEPDQLALVRVEELLPEPRRPRVRRGRVDRLAVVAAVDAVRRDDRLPLAPPGTPGRRRGSGSPSRS